MLETGNNVLIQKLSCLLGRIYGISHPDNYLFYSLLRNSTVGEGFIASVGIHMNFKALNNGMLFFFLWQTR